MQREIGYHLEKMIIRFTWLLVISLVAEISSQALQRVGVSGNPALETCMESAFERKSSKCSGAGTYKCGICDCEDGRFGRFCECSIDNIDYDGSSCIRGHSNFVCSGRGQCQCGKCICFVRPNKDEKVEGDFCECDNFSCNRLRGQLCGGIDHGTCVCGQCACRSGWTGDACECTTDNSRCIDPKDPSKKFCNGNGECRCGFCKCSDHFSGPFCEDCPTCPGKCAEFRDCVQCQAFGTGELQDNCNCSFVIEKFSEVKVNDSTEHACTFTDASDDCRFTFVYGFDGWKNPKVRVRETKECPLLPFDRKFPSLKNTFRWLSFQKIFHWCRILMDF